VTFQELAAKKVLGVPVLYLAAGFVAILAVVAWRMKSTPDADTSGVNPENGVAGSELDDPDNALAGMEGNGYSGFVTNGTVVVQPTTPTAEEPPEVNNDTWRKGATEWLVSQKKASGVEAYSALSKYLDGDQLSIEEGVIVNAAIAEKGLPPEPVAKVGGVAGPTEAPAQKQFSSFPGAHTVKGSNDNTATKLASLYYGNSDALHVNKIASANPALGPSSTTYNIGTRLTIPYYANPRYYTVTGKSDTWPSQIAAKNGLSYNQFLALNPSATAPYAKGAKMRVF
jgi:hypothetical protein